MPSLLTRCTVRLGPTMCKRQAETTLVYVCKAKQDPHTATLQLCERHAGQHRAGEIMCRTCRDERGVLDVPMELVGDEPFTPV